MGVVLPRDTEFLPLFAKFTLHGFTGEEDSTDTFFCQEILTKRLPMEVGVFCDGTRGNLRF